MPEKDYKPAANIAGASEFVGVLFCATGAWGGLEMAQHGLAGLTMGALPTLGVGLLLILAGRILRAVISNSNASAETLQIMRRLGEESPTGT